MRNITHMEIGQAIRQGDVLVECIGNADTPYTVHDAIPDGILALGEVTGHAHSAVASPTALFTDNDLDFLKEQAERLFHPIVFTDEECGRHERPDDKGILIQEVVAKIHATEPFCIIHWDQRTRVVPHTAQEAHAHGLHEGWQLPPGLYRVIRQVEPTAANLMVRD
jgi:hypothetical protein